MFNFAAFDEYGKQITQFIVDAKALLASLETEVKALRVENAEFKAQITRVEGAHLLLMEWLADIDDTEVQEAADVAELAADEAEAAAATAVAAATVSEEAAVVAVEEVTPPSEEIEMQESVPPAADETPAGEETPLPETPVPEEPEVAPEQVPTNKKKRFLI